ncbi:hypothetical protein [Clostridium aciditolerans]|uniref:Uncharacterized protein n=1 Tax=Clostridium aciditolerans TaxID=339861 RepID=A0A934I0Z7_9CLOT|nr:hypothetical protein [Clostridium aciditolerans]MBI6873056.1 hypothetical protein [Clostridium aciditolerans]
MIRKKGLLQVYNDSLTYKEILRKSFIDRIIDLKKYNGINIKAKNIDDIKIDFKNKNLFIIVDGEEIYVKFMTFPKVKKEKLHAIIKGELQYRFKNIDNIMFTYQIIKDNGSSLDVIVFLLNWSKSNLIKKCTERGGKIKGIFPIQFCILNNYKNRIKDKNYILIFIHENILYLLACTDNKMIANSVIKTFAENSFIDELKKFQVKCSISQEHDQFNKIFFLNFPYKTLIKDVEKQYSCIDLGNACCDNNYLV